MWSTLALEIASQPDELDALAHLDVPTLVIVGAEDSQFLEPSRAIAATVPGARYAEIPDAGHSPQFEHPVAWRAALVAFLDSL
jgi:pimeloyl-ACP methyl ester carboxylesterase